MDLGTERRSALEVQGSFTQNDLEVGTHPENSQVHAGRDGVLRRDICCVRRGVADLGRAEERIRRAA